MSSRDNQSARVSRPPQGCGGNPADKKKINGKSETRKQPHHNQPHLHPHHHHVPIDNHPPDQSNVFVSLRQSSMDCSNVDACNFSTNEHFCPIFRATSQFHSPHRGNCHRCRRRRGGPRYCPRLPTRFGSHCWFSWSGQKHLLLPRVESCIFDTYQNIVRWRSDLSPNNCLNRFGHCLDHCNSHCFCHHPNNRSLPPSPSMGWRRTLNWSKFRWQCWASIDWTNKVEKSGEK